MSNSLLIHDVLVDSSHIVSGNLNLSHSMMGETLAADDLTITIDAGMSASGGFYEGYIPLGDTEPYKTSDGGIYFLQCAPGEVYLTAEHEEYLTADEEAYFCAILPLDVSPFVPGDEMLYYWKNKLVGKYYLQKMTRQGRARYKLEATSAVGLLIQSTHYGGVYSDVKAGVIFAEILGNIPYSIDTALSNAVVYGYLPIASRRDNLQQLLFATGGALFTDNTGKLVISTIKSAIQGDFTSHRCYIGGSVEESDPVPAVDVTEHNYFTTAQQEPETLLEEGVDGTVTVQFNGPHYDLQCTGGTITESSENHAVIAAQAFVTLTGKPYQHITHIVRAGDSTAKENVRTVTNATLANPQIAQALAKRLYALLQCTTRIRQDVLFGDERAGQMVRVVNPYTLDTETAAVTEFDVTMSGVNKASGNFLVGFEPQGVLSGYQHYIVLTGSGSWTAPDEVAATGTMRVILCGAGSGGNGGQAGENGQAFNDGSEDYRSVATAKSDSRYGGDGGDGGKAGNGGAPGKIFEFTLTVSPGEVFSYSCGIGGSGGNGGLAEIKEERTRWEDNQEISYEEIIQAATQPADGAAGTATVFGGRSSDWGKEYPTGYYEPKTGLTIGVAGSDGYDGAEGGGGGYYPQSDADVVNAGGSPGKGVGASRDAGFGGDGGAGARRESTYIPPDAVVWASGGGGGGGGSYVANGSNGSDGDDATGGAGGAGASGGTSANGATYGCGGNGGHGGGGGGGGGAAFYRDFAEYQKAVAHAGKAGAGGAGGLAGNGADGCIIGYY